MAEEIDLSNGSLPREETSVKINLGMADSCISDECCCLRTRTVRRLAVCGLVCYCCPCVGALALVYAVKAREKEKANSHKAAKYWAKKSCCVCMLSVGACLVFTVLLFLLIILISYILSQAK